jgi:hypothetical protein
VFCNDSRSRLTSRSDVVGPPFFVGVVVDVDVLEDVLVLVLVDDALSENADAEL